MKNKIISLILALSLLVSVFVVLPTTAVAAEPDVNSVLSEEQKAAETLTAIEGVADGTAEAPYEIWNKAQLLDFAALVNGTGAHAESKNIYACAKLMVDVSFNEGYKYECDLATLLVKVTDANGVSAYIGTGIQTSAGTIATWYKNVSREAGTPEGFVKPTEWDPIGKAGFTNAYKGTFDGNGHTVSGIFVAKNSSGMGFFGITGSDTNNGVNITGITVKDSCIIGNGSTGGVVGYMGTNYGDTATSTAYCDHTIYPEDATVCKHGYPLNKTATANLASNENNGAGIKDIKISYSNNVNTIVTSSAEGAGGVVGNVARGYHYFKSTKADSKGNDIFYLCNRNPNAAGNCFKYLENSGTVVCKSNRTAGVVGYGDIGYYGYLTNYGTVYALGVNVAGICGGGDNIGATYLFNYGNVTGKDIVAGAANFNNRGISYSFNAGDVTATNGRAAGIAVTTGDGRSCTYCGNVGNIKGTSLVSGIYAGGKDSEYTIKYCYNYGDVTSTEGKAAQFISTAAAMTKVTMTGSLYLEGTVPNYGVTVAITDAPGTFKADEVASGELAERLGKSYFHQLLADSYPIPGGGNIQVPIEGEGTVESPYLIYNGRQMYELARRINSGYVNSKGETVAAQYRANVKLMADIDLNAGYDFDYVEDKYLVKVTTPAGAVGYIGTGYGSTTRGTLYKDEALTKGTPTGYVAPTTWTPMGTSTQYYKGTFDGNGKTISGLYIGAATTNYRGLFAYIGSDNETGVDIKGLTLADSCIIGQDYVGGITAFYSAGIGIAQNINKDQNACANHTQTITYDANGKIVSNEYSCSCNSGMELSHYELNTDGTIKRQVKESGNIKPVNITNCKISDDTVIAGNQRTGGVVGANGSADHYHRVNVVKVTLDANGEVASTSEAVLTPGQNDNGSWNTPFMLRGRYITYVQYCENNATIFASSSYAGGICGEGMVGTFKYDTNHGDIFSKSGNVGGIIGYGNNVTLSYLENYGDITSAGGQVAGLVGYANRGITYSFNEGNVTGTTKVAGIIGMINEGNQTVRACANVGSVTATDENGLAGGIAGGTRNQSGYVKYIVEYSYNYATITAAKYAAGIIALNDPYVTTLTLTRCYTINTCDIYKFGTNVTTLTPTVSNCDKVTEAQINGTQTEGSSLFSLLGTTHFGQSVNMAYPMPGFTTKLAGADVTLTDGILLNFYIDASTHLGVNSAELVEVEGKQYYKVTVEVAAKDMAKDITVQLAKNSTKVGVAHTYSVADYAAGILAGDNYDAKTKDLVQAMLNYGAAAQNYFGNNTEELVGTPVTDTSALENLEVDAPTITNPTNKYIGASLILEGKMKLRFYFRGNDVAVTVDGNDAAVVNGNKTYCYVDVDVTPDNIDKFYEVECADATVLYSALNYLKNNVANEALAEMVASIYAYNVAANAYVD